MATADSTHLLQTAIVHLLGYPGVGKYTIAKELVRLASTAEGRWVLVDNHLTGNVIFAVLPIDGEESDPLPPAVWDRVDDVRAALLQTIEQLSPAAWSFVFTNVVFDEDAAGLRSVRRVRSLADARGSRYVPVRLACEVEENLRRVGNPDRADRNKWRNVDAVRRQMDSRDIIQIDHPSLLELDVTRRSPTESAGKILEHLDDQFGLQVGLRTAGGVASERRVHDGPPNPDQA